MYQKHLGHTFRALTIILPQKPRNSRNMVHGHGGLRSAAHGHGTHGEHVWSGGDGGRAGGVAFEAMKVAQLKEELAARGSTRTGLKATLQRRLHSLLVQAGLSRGAVI